MFFRGIIIFLLLFLDSHIIKAQQPVYRHFTVNDGLPSSEVYSVIQDSSGYIWAATDRGICRFDGYHFTTYTTGDGLSDNTVFNICQDNKGRLWFYGLANKIDCYENGKIHGIILSRVVEESLSQGLIGSLYVDNSGAIWISMYRSGIVWKLTARDTVKYQGYKNNTFIRAVDSGFVCGNNYFTNNIETDTIIFDREGKKSAIVFKALPSETNKIICYKRRDGSYLMAKGRLLLHISNGKLINRCLLPSEDFISINEDHKGNIWITYNKLGATCYKEEKNHLRILSTHLPGKIVSRVFEDREGNLWFGTARSGLYLLTSRAFLAYTLTDGFASNMITNVCGDENIVWASTDNGKIYGLKNGRIFKTINVKNKDNIIQSIFYDKNKNLWIGAITANYNYSNGTLKSIYTNDGSARRFCQGKKDVVWGGRSTLDKFDYKKKRCTSIPGLDCYINAICEDNEGRVWIGCTNGLWCYNGKGFKYMGDVNKLFKTRITDIKMMKDHSLWITTLGKGVVIKKGDSIIQFDTRDGLPSNLCNGLFIDDYNTIWVYTNEGLCRITRQDNKYTVKNYTNANGLISNEIHGVFRQGKKIWVATSGGLNVFDIDEAETGSYIPPLYISSVKINGRDTAAPDNFRLNYNQNFISLSFTGLLYKNAGHIKYRYKMTGLDTSWIYTTFTSVQYSSLLPGNYKFIVNAADNNGNWGNNYASMNFSISNPVWKTTWFWFCIAVFFVSIAALIIFTQMRQFFQKNRLLEQLNQYKHHAFTAQMNPHFIFNSLNSIQKYILENDKISSNKYLTKFAHLMRLTLENSLQTVISLGEEINALRLYIELEKLRFKDKLLYEIHINPLIDLEKVKIPALLIQPYVENAIRHGIMPKETTGLLVVNIDIEKDSIVCTVEDNGVGRDFQKTNTKKVDYHLSAGMEITKNRIEIINSLYKKNMQIEVIDIKDEKNNPAGTIVKINLPLN
jgi:ligand-binding sensor domain-containing protein